MDFDDRIFAGYLIEQRRQLAQLAAKTDMFTVSELDPQHFLVHFRCRGLIKHAQTGVTEHEGFVVGFFLHPGFTRHVIEPLVLTLFAPTTVFHANCLGSSICVGKIAPSTPLVELVYRTFAVLSYQELTTHEANALNREACAWARNNLARLPVDPRPLIWRRDGGHAHDAGKPGAPR